MGETELVGRLDEEPARASSRESVQGAGWDCSPGSYLDRLDKRSVPFSWLNPLPLWRSRNDRLARGLGDPTNDRRRAWLQVLDVDRADLVLDRPGAETSFLVLGDTGEGDASQLAVVPALEARADGTDFLFIASDVIYPAGGVNDYRRKFFEPYKDYPRPIYAVPGNHDWYDDGVGFMYWFCGAEQAPRRPRARFLTRAWLRDLIWRRAPKVDEQDAREMRKLRPRESQEARQPAPYFAIDAGPLRLVGIDTGITGTIDREQAEWLRWVSASSPRPKILLTGKPIYVDGEHRPGPIEGGGFVDEIVTALEHNYIAAIGGDIHNYQRYPVALDDGRTLLYLVSGGGGAFMHATHTIDNVDNLDVPVAEAEFRCYPLRGDSLSRYSLLWARKLRWLIGPLWRRLPIDPDQAAAIMGRRLAMTSTRASAGTAHVTRRARFAASLIFRLLPSRGRRGLHIPFSEWLDWNAPPMFKSFLRVDATDDEVTVRCYAATGCASQEDDPPVEDELRATRGDDGHWQWTYDKGAVDA